MVIWICDDSVDDRERIGRLIEAELEKKERTYLIQTFGHSNSLLTSYKATRMKPDLLLLDIDMPECNGLKLAQKIREEEENQLLMFVSSYDQYVFEAFRQQPYRFIRKGYLEEELRLALVDVERYLKLHRGMDFVLQVEEGDFVLSIHDMIYFELEGRKIVIHLLDGRVFHLRSAIKHFAERVCGMAPEYFTFIHSSCVVNAEYVQSLKKDCVILRNQEVLMMSRRYQKVVKEKLYDYWAHVL